MPFRSPRERLVSFVVDPALAEDVRRLLEEFTDDVDWLAAPSPCTPALDLFDTGDAYELVLDIPGVVRDEVRVLVKHDLVVILGEKRPGPCSDAQSARFHLAERSFGRFVRAVRLGSATDGTRAQATLKQGELRLVVPKVTDRRARDISVPVVQS